MTFALAAESHGLHLRGRPARRLTRFSNIQQKDGICSCPNRDDIAVNAALTISPAGLPRNAVEPESLMSRQLQGEADGVTPTGFFSGM